MTDIYKQAIRKQLRFATQAIGELTIEQLWQLPLTARGNKVDLDSLAMAVQAELQTLAAGSFVRKSPDPRQVELTLKLDILKDVIATKLAEEDEAKLRAQNAELKQELLEIEAEDQKKKLREMSAEERKALLSKL